MKAIWNNTIIAESNDTVVVENNHYFPPEAIHKVYFKKTDTRWMGRPMKTQPGIIQKPVMLLNL